MSEASENPQVMPAQKRPRQDPELSHKSAIIKRSIELHGHKTSVSLEDQFWDGLRFIAEVKRTPLPALLQTIDSQRGHANMSSAIRVFVLEYYRNLSTAQATQAGRPAA